MPTPLPRPPVGSVLITLDASNSISFPMTS
jgi:hypothetical protein